MPERSKKAAPATALAVVVTLSLLVAACSTNREVTKPDPLPITDSLLEEGLLTAADLPSDWTAATGSGTPISTEVVTGHDCDDALTALDPKASASADFSTTGVELTDTLAWFPGQGRAAEEVYRDLAEDCRALVLADRGESIRTAPLNFGVLSNDTVALRIEVEPTTGQIIERDLIVMRRGDLLHVVRMTGPRPSDKALLDRVVRVAMGHLGRLHADTT